MNTLLKLIKSFMIIGIGAYGGGLVTIPLIQHEIIDVQKWLKMDELASLLAIAQMTPGPIAINAATFVGFKIGSGLGAFLATTSVITPSILILTFIVPLLKKINLGDFAERFKIGTQIGVLSLIIFAVWSYSSRVIENIWQFFIAFFAFFILIIFEGKIHPIFVILSCGLLGLIFF